MIKIVVTHGECPFNDCVDYYSFVYDAQVWEAVYSPRSEHTWARQRTSGKWLDHPIKIVVRDDGLPPVGEKFEPDMPPSVHQTCNLIDSRDIMPERPRRWDDQQAFTRTENIELTGVSDKIRQALTRLENQL